ncbi:MAG: cell wall-binding repeat-containing protein [Acidimicrobiales bacterium]
MVSSFGPREAAAGTAPPGGQILYERGLHLWLMHGDGSAQRELGHAPLAVPGSLFSSMSPDGSHAVLLDSQGVNGLLVVDGDGGNPTPIGSGVPPGVEQRPLAWGPSRVAFGARPTTGTFVIGSILPDGSGYSEVSGSESCGASSGYSWSPDGSVLAFAGGQSPQHPADCAMPARPLGIYTAPPVGGTATLINNGGSGPLAWSPDGTEILFMSASSQGISAMAPDGSNPRQVVPPNPGRYVASLAWSPDGGFFAVSRCPTNTLDTSTCQIISYAPNGSVAGQIGQDGSILRSWRVLPPSTPVPRLDGTDRIATAVAAAGEAFPLMGSAKTAVLATSADFADALAGGPLAASMGGPLLLTTRDHIASATAGELLYVLPKGARVTLLGGTSALSAGVDQDVQRLGFTTRRIAGATRFSTATAIAAALGNPPVVFEADGTNFPDALSAGPAAITQSGTVLLTNGASQSPDTAAYLSGHPQAARYAVGGAAAAADPGAQAIVGQDRYATAAMVAGRFFAHPAALGIATGQNFPDALGAGPDIASRKGPLLLVPATTPLPSAVSSYLASTRSSAGFAYTYGGAAAVSEDVRLAVKAALNGR